MLTWYITTNFSSLMRRLASSRSSGSMLSKSAWQKHVHSSIDSLLRPPLHSTAGTSMGKFSAFIVFSTFPASFASIAWR